MAQLNITLDQAEILQLLLQNFEESRSSYIAPDFTNW